MPSMRALLTADPSLPLEIRDAISSGDDAAREHLLALGVDDCEASELLDEAPPAGAVCD